MSPLPCSLAAAIRSDALHPSHKIVFAELHHAWLDDREFKSVPAWHVAELLSVDESLVYRALDALTRAGFLEQGDRLGNGRTFRIASQREQAA